MNKKNNLEVSLTKEICIICCKEMDGPIIMNQILTEVEAAKVKKLHKQVIGFSEKPCKECQKNMEKAFMFIGFDEEKSDMDKIPEGFYRTGHIIGVKKGIPLVQEWVKEQASGAIEKGYLFTPYNVMKKIGLIKNN